MCECVHVLAAELVALVAPLSDLESFAHEPAGSLLLWGIRPSESQRFKETVG